MGFRGPERSKYASGIYRSNCRKVTLGYLKPESMHLAGAGSKSSWLSGYPTRICSLRELLSSLASVQGLYVGARHFYLVPVPFGKEQGPSCSNARKPISPAKEEESLRPDVCKVLHTLPLQGQIPQQVLGVEESVNKTHLGTVPAISGNDSMQRPTYVKTGSHFLPWTPAKN